MPVRYLIPLLIAMLLASMSTQACADESALKLLARGAAVFAESCASCHGARGEGTEEYAHPLQGDLTVAGLAKRIAETMPEGAPDSCVGDDSAAVAAWIHAEFYSEAARARQQVPRVRLARLTGEQLRQSLADLYAFQHGVIRNVEERGLTARYFNETNMAGDKQQFERIDANIDFDFGHDGPGDDRSGDDGSGEVGSGKTVTADDFSISWRGGLRADRTGPYEIIVRSTCAFDFCLGEYQRKVIDNNTQSGDKTEFRKSLTLTGGRVYPFEIRFRQRKRKTEQPPAKIVVSWIPPESTEHTIPSDAFLPVHCPPAFALQAWLPPDDRSYGFDRGISVDREWDESTTNAAIEFATFASTELWPAWRDEHKDTPTGNRQLLKEFLQNLLSVAFRGAVDDDIRRLYIDRQLEETEDDVAAIRRVLLASLKSPRFLYPLIDGNQSASQRAANRLALMFYDSLPADKSVRKRVSENSIESDRQIREVAWGMVNDHRARFKTRQMILEWLNVRPVADIAKDEMQFPDFNAELLSDLRDSLDQSIDRVINSEDSDYRQLFLNDVRFESPRLKEFYGEDPRTGLLSHPYLLCSLAYRDTTSPIHRGVFLLRHVLGRTLNPPNEAFTPLSPELHPDLTTRERIELQTGSDNCQVCHRQINGLGFVLEDFDAVGKHWDKERGKRIDSAGVYVDRAGEEIRFDGVKALADYLANSEDAQRAFVDRAFRYFVKQPAAAWGPDTLDHLTQRFRDHNCSIRMLLIEIAAVAASPPKSASAVSERTTDASE